MYNLFFFFLILSSGSILYGHLCCSSLIVPFPSRQSVVGVSQWVDRGGGERAGVQWGGTEATWESSEAQRSIIVFQLGDSKIFAPLLPLLFPPPSRTRKLMFTTHYIFSSFVIYEFAYTRKQSSPLSRTQALTHREGERESERGAACICVSFMNSRFSPKQENHKMKNAEQKKKKKQKTGQQAAAAGAAFSFVICNKCGALLLLFFCSAAFIAL